MDPAPARPEMPRTNLHGGHRRRPSSPAPLGRPPAEAEGRMPVIGVLSTGIARPRPISASSMAAFSARDLEQAGLRPRDRIWRSKYRRAEGHLPIGFWPALGRPSSSGARSILIMGEPPAFALAREKPRPRRSRSSSGSGADPFGDGLAPPRPGRRGNLNGGPALSPTSFTAKAARSAVLSWFRRGLG